MNIHSVNKDHPVKKTDKHDEIVRASLELIAEKGFHGVPMSMIAKKPVLELEQYIAILIIRMLSLQNCIMILRKKSAHIFAMVIISSNLLRIDFFTLLENFCGIL